MEGTAAGAQATGIRSRGDALFIWLVAGADAGAALAVAALAVAASARRLPRPHPAPLDQRVHALAQSLRGIRGPHLWRWTALGKLPFGDCPPPGLRVHDA